ncbi:DNA-directed RNA polymerase subunit beta' [Thermosporothrix hazakensis]|jgi:DNA-directed RNA polymerase subunit beta'|uniref:DNA-directed RNA polymerase subunit beta' n=2 Tax=Thermosporothrix TaxID=768650 RepID=A0A326U1Z0_THEHA|nr:DNA-directed RNA polymerase subunit beta' [Thermosporothrix hazakensis]PZW24176.1 DNA-directed RNA polymerase subunit beta' [Thermosporothrix hazakensis]BBH89622.1 DNA-directed RNA polymerase subunit beta' [Thermosporothrix sp. COM3]GCE47808.1 DNA-directed RNA polymerase subunit beta' [Thermosporothrix hazakensis]
MLEVNDFNAIRISLASPEQIRSWSYGEVTKPETINYRTLKPEKDGLFCERIFGPTKDWECYCGKYKRVRFKGIVCDKCGVEVARSKVRRERMGHIELASPVSHIWYFKGTPSRIGLLLDLSPRNLERILYFALYVVTNVDEEARQRELMRLDQELQELDTDLNEKVVERINSLKTQRDDAIRENATRLKTVDRQSIEERRERDLEDARREESETLAELRENMNKVVDFDIVYTPSDTVIVRDGEVVSPKHIEVLERVAETKRNAIAEQARRELDAAIVDNKREADRLGLEYQGQIDTAQAQLERERAEAKARLDALRRDLESLKKMDLLQENRYRELKDAFPDVFTAGMGAEAVRELIASIDLDKLAADLRHEINSTVGQRRKKATKRLKVVEAFRKSSTSPEWMILTVLPVLPPELRPMVQLDGGRFATSDLNDLYRRVINRNNRLKRLLELGAPEIIIRNEKRMLQEACDALIDNGRRGRAVAGSGNHKLKSLSDMLKGKQGRFRQNLLGKRVDYSGRSVIVVGPELKLHQCGLPKRMALELFKPFVMRKLVEQNFAHNIKSAKRFVERVKPEVWDVLEEVIKNHPVLLNRAPTLHRLGIQAFEAVLVEGSAIQLHPLVCSAFNADFDGDQMAVHVPLSEKAQDEARRFMMSTRNLLSPAHGEPSIGASQDMVLGCFYLTQERPNKKGEGRVFTDTTEALLAYHHGFVELQARIKVRLGDYDIYDDAPPTRPSFNASGGKLVETTIGRIIFNEALPERLRFRNYAMKKENLRQVIADCFKIYGRVKTTELADEIKRLGFNYATKAGATIAISDVKVPIAKQAELEQADEKIAELEEQYRDGLITENEKYQQTVDIWNEVTENVTKMVEGTLDPFGSIYTIAKSGATKAKFQQIRQLSGMRGLMTNPSGKIIPVPIRGNFREGLSVLEYFISSHGARKGLADTALRTAESGYLTRRLIDVAQDVIVNEEDCGTTDGILITEEDSKEMGLDNMRSRLIGRVLAEEIPGLEHIKVNDELTEDLVDEIVEAGIQQVRVRSVLTCAARRGVCRLCYGRDLAANALASIGAAVGIIAAQSIGEPGTQLTMRTFHTGGIAGAQGDITLGLPRVEELFEARVPKDKAEISEIDGVVEIVKDEESGQRTVRVVASNVFFDEYKLPAGTEVMVADGEHVQKDQVIALMPAEGGNEPVPVLARTEGDIVHNASENGDVLSIRFEERDERSYVIPAAKSIVVENGQRITAGTPITSGQKDPQDVLRIQGREAVQIYLVKEVQRVYRNTGVYNNDKHIEVIVRQMLRRVKIEDPGDTDMLPNDLVDRFTYEETNARILAEGGEPATAQTVLLGVTKASLNTDSFLAAASFQETTRVLTEAAIEAQTDHLIGLKENVIIGKLIPAGSGIAQRRKELQARQQAMAQLLESVSPVPAGVGGLTVDSLPSNATGSTLGLTLDSEEQE